MSKWALFGLGIAILLAAFGSPFASSFPDGLEKVAEELGFIDTAVEAPLIRSPIPDYAVPGIRDETTATGLAGLAGTVLVFGAAVGLGKVLKKGKDDFSK